MTWFPWVAVPARSNITTGEVVDWLRYRAIDFGAPSAFVDALDDLVLAETAQEEIDELTEKLETCETQRDALKDALRALLGASTPDTRDAAEEALDGLE